MKLKGLLLLALLFSTGLVNAQSNYKLGYIIKNPGDTIYGQIDYRGDLIMSRTCKFKSDDNTVVKYFPEDIIAYRFIDGKYYISREINGKKVFLEYLIKGKVNIYYLRDDFGNHYYIDKDDMKMVELPYEEGKKFVDNKEVYYETTKHLGLLYTYMHDAPVMEPMIKSIKKPEHKSLIKLAEYYHNVVCYGEKCIIYENKAPLFNILPEISVGFIDYGENNEMTSSSDMLYSITAHIWMPRTNEKMYFKTGLVFNPVDFNGEKCDFKIPCHFEYIYPKGIFRPRLAYGLNFYKLRKITSSLNLGFNLQLTENIFISATSDIEFNTKTLIIPNSFCSYSLQLGMVFDFK